MGGPIVRAMWEEREEVALLFGIFGKEFQLTVPLGAELVDSRHEVAADPFASPMKATKTTTNLDKKRSASGKGDKLGRPSMRTTSPRFRATYRPRTS